MVEVEDKGTKYVCALVKPTNVETLKFLENYDFDQGEAFYWMGRMIG